MRICLQDKETMTQTWVTATSHKLREGWRRYYFKQFMTGTRHEVEGLKGTIYEEKVIKDTKT